MAWVATDKDRGEFIFNDRPLRREAMGEWWADSESATGDMVLLPDGTIEKLIGRQLTWEDEPVELYNS